MVWSEKTSGPMMGDTGMMNTYDMETYKYFRNSSNYRGSNRVTCALAPRQVRERKEVADRMNCYLASAIYTHHQKSVVCDAPDPGSQDGRRKLVAYVGGLDLTAGRYDTPEHNIFSTLKTDHHGDFRNKGLPKSTAEDVGPREPWHDIHSRVEGPVAMDVLQNFIDRWVLQGEGWPPLVNQQFSQKINPNAVASLDHPEKEWNVQLFRSITSDSAKLETQGRERLVLTSKKGRLVDQSITQAYVQMVRQAKNFIYIENQYFMGSAFQWRKDSNVLCNHIIPVEIIAKISNKMRSGERFTAYIVIPMWPEGDPTSGPMQAILFWQMRTIEMMYLAVGKALRECQVPPSLGQHPTDWLVFLCPGKSFLLHPNSICPKEPGSCPAPTWRCWSRPSLAPWPKHSGAPCAR
jgi:phospholipase D1/2